MTAPPESGRKMLVVSVSYNGKKFLGMNSHLAWF
jgi:hypothetical protein